MQANRMQFKYIDNSNNLPNQIGQDLKKNFFRGVWGIPAEKIEVQLPRGHYSVFEEALNALRENIKVETGFPTRNFCISAGKEKGAVMTIMYYTD